MDGGAASGSPYRLNYRLSYDGAHVFSPEEVKLAKSNSTHGEAAPHPLTARSPAALRPDRDSFTHPSPAHEADADSSADADGEQSSRKSVPVAVGGRRWAVGGGRWASAREVGGGRETRRQLPLTPPPPPYPASGVRQEHGTLLHRVHQRQAEPGHHLRG